MERWNRKHRSPLGYALIGLALIAVALISAFVWQRHAGAPGATAATVVSIEQGAVGVVPFDVAIGGDESGSVYGALGAPATDPRALRYVGMRTLIGWLRSQRGREGATTVTLVQYGSEPKITGSYDLIRDADALERALHPPGPMGNTATAAALRRCGDALGALREEGGSRRQVVILYTDGSPYDNRALGQDAYFREIAEEVRQLREADVDIWLVALGSNSAEWRSTESSWRDLLGNTRVVTAARPEDLPNAFDTVARLSLDLTDEDGDLLASRGTWRRRVGSYISGLTMRLVAVESSATVRLSVGAHAPVEVDMAGQGEVRELAIAGSADTTVTVAHIQGGPVLVAASEAPIALAWAEPTATVAAGTPIIGLLRITDLSGAPIVEHQRDPLRIEASVELPTPPGAPPVVLPVRLEQIAPGQYAGSSEGVWAEGEARVTTLVQSASGMTSSYTTTVTAVPTQGITLDDPKAPTSLPISSALRVSGRLTGGSIARGTAVLATLRDPSGATLSRQWVNPRGDTIQAEIAHVPRAGVLQLDVYDAAGACVSRSAMPYAQSPTQLQRLEAFLLRWMPWAAVLVAAVLLTLLAFVLTRTRMVGAIEVSAGDASESVPVMGRRLASKTMRPPRHVRLVVFGSGRDRATVVQIRPIPALVVLTRGRGAQRLGDMTVAYM